MKYIADSVEIWYLDHRSGRCVSFLCISIHHLTNSYEKREANQEQATIINVPPGLKDMNLVLL